MFRFLQVNTAKVGKSGGGGVVGGKVAALKAKAAVFA